MANRTNQYDSDYAVPPGWVLEERLDVQGMSHAEFARRCGRSPKLISEIISGKAPLEPETALQFEKVLGVDASVWLGIESEYKLHRARQNEAEAAVGADEWARDFPVVELVKRGIFERPESDADAVTKLLAFFRVGSIDAWTARYGLASVAYRHSPRFESDESALATWRRLGEIEAEDQDCADYSESRFRKAAQLIRGLTREDLDEALQCATELCNQAGVALALVRPLPKTALSGAAWWLSPGRPVIQLSARHKSDDHLWFSFFHEAAHIVLHSKKSVFVDEVAGNGTEIEEEANRWAARTLVPPHEWRRFVATSPRSKRTVRTFARTAGNRAGDRRRHAAACGSHSLVTPERTEDQPGVAERRIAARGAILGARRLTRGGTGHPVLTRMDLSMNYVCAAKTPEEDSSASVGRGSLTTVPPSPSLGGSARIARSLSCCSLIQSAASGHSLSSSRIHLLRTETVIPFSLFFSKFSPSSWSPIWSRILHDYRRIRDALSCDAQPSPARMVSVPTVVPGG